MDENFEANEITRGGGSVKLFDAYRRVNLRLEAPSRTLTEFRLKKEQRLQRLIRREERRKNAKINRTTKKTCS